MPLFRRSRLSSFAAEWATLKHAESVGNQLRPDDKDVVERALLLQGAGAGISVLFGFGSACVARSALKAVEALNATGVDATPLAVAQDPLSINQACEDRMTVVRGLRADALIKSAEITERTLSQAPEKLDPSMPLEAFKEEYAPTFLAHMLNLGEAVEARARFQMLGAVEEAVNLTNVAAILKLQVLPGNSGTSSSEVAALQASMIGLTEAGAALWSSSAAYHATHQGPGSLEGVPLAVLRPTVEAELRWQAEWLRQAIGNSTR
jgi:hypothetical protein